MDTREGEPATPPGPPPRRFEISLTQLVAGSAAAVCGAWLASRIGVAGTVIGAGLVSALVTVLSAVYAHGARRAQERLADRLEAIRTRGPLPASYSADSPGAPHPGTGVAGQVGAAGQPDQAPLAGQGDADGRTVPARALLRPPFDLEDARGYRWGRILLAALAVFVLGMGVVTVVELVAGHSLACTAAGIGCQGTTTLPLPGHPRPASTPVTTPSATQTPTTATPTPSSTSSVSSTTSPTGSPSTTGSPSSTPSTSTSPSSGSPTPTTSPTG